ncbi:MAG: carboxypeptidase regulatory-like domain-containing protein [Acutalibacteraceae bacterium]|nr:carboxypeptidase regulatory-like domain-containing protein [Acutalibacteraceae bacterium]
MFCKNCGNQISDNTKFCKFCGAPVDNPAAPVQPQNQQQPVSVANNPTPAKNGNNLGLKITAIVLVLAVLLVGGYVGFFGIKNSNELKEDGVTYIDTLPTLRQNTEFAVFDAEKFPAEKYEITVERFLMGGIFKNVSSRKQILHDTSSDPVYNIDFGQNGNYRITLKDITAVRTQVPSTDADVTGVPQTQPPYDNEASTSKSESTTIEVIIIIDVVVDDEDPDAVDNVDLDSKPVTTTEPTEITMPDFTDVVEESTSEESTTEETTTEAVTKVDVTTETQTSPTDRIIAGKVLSSDRNSPVSGAIIKVFKGNNQIATASSDMAGLYMLTIPAGKYRVTITVAGYKPAEFELDLTGNTNVTKQVYLEPVASGTVSGKVCKAADQSSPVSGAKVEFYKGSTLQTSVTTNSSGNYTANLPAGDYTVKVTHSGYQAFSSYANVTLNKTTYMETVLLVQSGATENGTVKGKVMNSLTKEGVGGVTLTVKNNWNNTSGSGSTVKTATTDANGYYTLSLPVGNYTVIATKSGYTSSSFNIVSQRGTTDNQNGLITPVISGDDYLITLTWGEEPEDLDSHLVGKTSNGSTYHVYWKTEEAYENGDIICELDYDETYGFGPEHTTLTTVSDDAHYFYVYKYSGYGSLASSGAKVTVEQGNKVIAVFNVPTDQGDGEYWNVFAIKDGKLIVKDAVTSSPDTTYAG